MEPLAGTNRDARERALHLLYEADQRGMDADEVLAGQVVAPDRLSEQLVRGVLAAANEWDELISRFAVGWDIARMPALDRTIMRIASFELASRADTPTAVILNEAVELAHDYGGTDDSPRFVNGVLASIARELRPEA